MESYRPRPDEYYISNDPGLTGGKDPRGDRRLQVRIALIGATGAIIAAAVGAVMSTKPWSHPGPSPSPVSASPCVFLAPNTVTCTSSNPVVTLEFNNEVSSMGCTFSSQINWGDGSEQTFNFPGSTAGPYVIGDHIYKQKGTYRISGNTTTTSGPCVVFQAVSIFTLS